MGFLWHGAYRDASLGASDASLHAVTENPLYVEKSDAELDGFICPNDHAFSAIYQAQNNGTLCADLNVEGAAARVAPSTCRFESPLMRNGGAGSGRAVKYFRGQTYALAMRNGIVLLRSGAGGREEEILQIPGTGELGDHAEADFYIDESGVSVIWGRIPERSESGDQTPDARVLPCARSATVSWTRALNESLTGRP